MGGLQRKGMYDIIVAFFLVLTLVFAIVLFLYMNTSSSILYGKMRQDIAGPREATTVKDMLLACHRLDYLHESMFDEPCPAKGYRVTQYPLNGCAEKTWTEPREGYRQAIPFVVTVEQASGARCLARLEVFL